MEEIYKLALTDNPVDLVVDKNLKVSSSINAALPEEETILLEHYFNYNNEEIKFIVPNNVKIVKVKFSTETGNFYSQTNYIKVTPNTNYVLNYYYERGTRTHFISSSTKINYIEYFDPNRASFERLSISYSASINKETNIYNSDYINDDNYIYYYVSTRATSSSDVTTKHQVTKNTTWQQAIDSGQNYAGITFNENGIACCRNGSTLMGAMYVNDIIESDAKYGFYEVRLDV